MNPLFTHLRFQSLETRIARRSNHWKSALLPLAALLLAACGEKVAPGHQAVASGVPVPAGAAVHTVAATSQRELVDVLGTVASAARVQVSAQLNARVEAVLVKAGDAVTNGQLLVRLEGRDLREQLAAAEAQLGQAEAEWKRVSTLFERQAATDMMRTAAEAGVRAARAQAERMRVMLSWTDVRAPFAGVVTDRQVEPGDLVGPGQTLCTVYDPLRLRLEAHVPARLLSRLPLGADVQVQLDYPARAVPGQVEEIVAEADPVSRTQKVKIRLAATDGLQPGQFGRLLVAEAEQQVLLIPATAIYRSGQLTLVQLVRAGRAERRLIRTGAASGERVQVLSGLTAGDTILERPVL